MKMFDEVIRDDRKLYLIRPWKHECVGCKGNFYNEWENDKSLESKIKECWDCEVPRTREWVLSKSKSFHGNYFDIDEFKLINKSPIGKIKVVR